MGINIALAGNPNSGKTTLFNALTGARQFVGNWPGVTVERKEGRLKGPDGVTITDLPGIYSLSPYTPEEIIARDYLIREKPDVILNIVDGTNLERNLYLTTQLMELGIPVMVAINLMDAVDKSGDKIDTDSLSDALGCGIVEISALRGTGVMEAAKAAITAAEEVKPSKIALYDGALENTLEQIGRLLPELPAHQRRWYAIKVFERDRKALSDLNLPDKNLAQAKKIITEMEAAIGDDAESIITNARYEYIAAILRGSYQKKAPGKRSSSDRIDRLVTNRWLALPIFAAVMFLIYFISVTTIGAWASDWANEGVFGEGWHLPGSGGSAYMQAAAEYKIPAAQIQAFESAAETAGLKPGNATKLTVTAYLFDETGNTSEAISTTYGDYTAALALNEPEPADYGIWVPGIPTLLDHAMSAANVAPWLHSLLLDGIIGGVGAVLGFVPQMLVLFLLLAFLEGCGYMARIAFIMDRAFRKIGLSGKSFIPMLIGTGCSVPGIMAARTIENERDRRMTIITTSFMPCGAKLPVIALIAGAMFGGAAWVAPSAYFAGIAAIAASGVILKKTRMFAGDPSPFVMELPSYRLPTIKNLLLAMWERGMGFVRKAGSIILLSSIVIWFASNFGWDEHGFGMVGMNNSILAGIGSAVSFVFAPLGWGSWQATAATVTGFIAKENIVGTFGILYGGFAEVAESGWQVWGSMRASFTPLSAYSFLLFNLLCAPCFAAIGAIRREMNNAKWTAFALAFQTALAYSASLIFFQVSLAFSGAGQPLGFISALILLGMLLYLLAKPNKGIAGLKQVAGV